MKKTSKGTEIVDYTFRIGTIMYIYITYMAVSAFSKII